MIKRLTAVGNSLGLIIERLILEPLGIDKETPLEVRTDGGPGWVWGAYWGAEARWPQP